MIQFKNLECTRGHRVLIQGASLQWHPGHKVGITGANGAGKSSLFALLLGELHASQGALEMPPGWVIAHVAQETPALPESALEFTLGGDAEWLALSQTLAQTQQQSTAVLDGTHIAELHARYQEIDGYTAQARAAALLDGLGFGKKDLQRPVAEFSGGWRVRLNLARALMCRSDLLLLDEPTNHLDLDAVIWLESWLQSYRGTLLLVSHDREFLDSIVNHIAHIAMQKLTLYRGNYSDFEQQRAAQALQQQAMFEKQQHQVAHLQQYITRFRAKATKARQAQSRIKALERMELLSAAHIDSPMSFEFLPCQTLSDPLLVLDQAAVGYAGNTLLGNIALTLRPGERLGLLGRNGAGKSTLIKLLAGILNTSAGKITQGKYLSIGYFAQHQLEQLRPDESPLQHMLRLDPESREQDHRNYLGSFDFRGEMATSPCGHFSGGEKSRLALALLIRTRPNLLLLDEPTNHLDMETRHALTMAMQNFEGCVVIVSHDRALLRATCDQFALVADGRVQAFDGDLDDYKAWLDQLRQQTKAAAKNTAPPRPDSLPDRSSRKAERQTRLAERRPLLKQLSQLEADMAKWHTEKQALEQSLADESLYLAADKSALQHLLKRQAELTEWIDTAEMTWLDVQGRLESLQEID